MSTMRMFLICLAVLLPACGSSGGGGIVVPSEVDPLVELFDGDYHMAVFGGSSGGGGSETFFAGWGQADVSGIDAMIDYAALWNHLGVITPNADTMPFHVEPDRSLSLIEYLPSFDFAFGGVSERGDIAAAAATFPIPAPMAFLFVRPTAGLDNVSVAGTYHFGALGATAVGATTAASWGRMTFDGAGGGSAEMTTNAEGVVIGPFPVPLTYNVKPGGGFSIDLGGALTLEGALALDGELAVLGGGTLAGDNPAQYVLVREAAGLSDADLTDRRFLVGVTQETGSNVYTSISGHLLVDGLGGGAFIGQSNTEGDVRIEPPSNFTTSVAPDGSLELNTGGGDVLRGALSADGGFGFLAGPDTPGSDPSFFFFFR